MATIDEALALAMQHHRAGQMSAARDIYSRILEVDARNFNALHLLGVVERQGGNPALGAGLIARAIAVNPNQAEIHNNHGNALAATGDSDGAMAAYRRSLALSPDFNTAGYALGTLLARGGPDTWPAAIATLRRVTRVAPGFAEAHHDLRVVLRQSEFLDEAIASYLRGLAIKCDFAAGHMSLGNAYVEQGGRAAAIASFRRGLALAPAGPELYYNLGNALHACGMLDEARTAYLRAVRLGLNSGLVRAASVLVQAGDDAGAEALLVRSLTVPKGEIPTSIDMLAALMIRGGRVDEAKTLFQTLTSRPLIGSHVFLTESLTALATLALHENRPEDALALLARANSDNSRFFTVKSVAAFRSTLGRLGTTLSRPANPAPDRPRVTSSTLATHGRFAHNVLEYILLRLYAETYGYVLETPDWVGGYFFDVDDPAPSGPLSPLYFPRRIVNRLVAEPGTAPPVPDCDILSPLFLLEHKEIWRQRVQSWLKPRAMWRPFLDPAMERLRARGRTVVAIHIRRGDFIQFKYPITETAWYVTWLEALWPTLDRPVLYIASDDLAGVKQDFAAFAPVSRTDLVEDWPGLEFLQDFHVLMHADVVGISAASGYSLLAARLNANASLFAEPDVKSRSIRPFQPWTP
jgi:tetratricopeptide (TPR) repeat protein